MLCFKDRTFCGSSHHKSDCERRMTDSERAEAKMSGLPVAYADYCADLTEVVETPEERKETREERHSRLSDHWSEL